MSRCILIGLFFGLLLASCAPLTPVARQEPLATPTAAPLGDWSLRMTQPGGIMGLRRSVEISSDGTMTVTDERTKKTVTAQLGDDDLARLKDLLSTMAYTDLKSPAVCADCFVYALSVDRGSGKPWTVTLDDMSLDSSGLSDLIGLVRGLMDKALQP